MSRQTVIKASAGHRTFGKLLKRVYDSDEHLIVERAGFPVAVLMSYQEYQALTHQQAVANFRQLSRALNKEAEEQGLTEEDLLEEIKRIRKDVVEEEYGELE